MGARPHWGKLFTLAADRLGGRYEKMDDFRQLIETHDPHRRFGNAFLEEYIY